MLQKGGRTEFTMETKTRLELQTKAFVTDLLAGVDREDDFQETMNYIIKEVGMFTQAEKVCIYEPGSEKKYVEKVYQWVAGAPEKSMYSGKPDCPKKFTNMPKSQHPEKSGNSAEEDVEMQVIQEDTTMQMIPQKEIDGWIRMLNQKHIVVIEEKDVICDSMPEEYAIMDRAGIETLLLIPIDMAGKLNACMVVMNPDFSKFALLERTWLYLGEQMGVNYHRERISHRYLLFMEGIRSGNLSEFIVDCTTKRYEAFRITKVLRNTIPEEGDWDWLRQFYAAIIKPEYREEVLRKTEWEYLKTYLCTAKSTFAIDIEREVNGSNHWFRLEFSVVSLDESGMLERFTLQVKDITQMKREEEEHQQMIRALSSIYSTSAIIEFPEKMVHPIQFSIVAQKFLANEPMPDQILLEAFCSRMVQPDYETIVREFMDLDTMQQRFQDTNLLTCEYQGLQMEWGRINLTPVQWSPEGVLEKVVFAVQDITEQKQREEWMQFKIEHDELTGTLNRAAFNRTTKLLRDSDMPFGFVLLDIDKFKSINDTYGHDVGDQVLKHLVSVLNDKMRAVDKIFRLGGDEFAVIMNRLSLDQAGHVKRIVKDINEAIMAGNDGMPSFSISAGATFSVSGYDDMIYHNADQALYRTKETTHRGCTIFEEIKHSSDL